MRRTLSLMLSLLAACTPRSADAPRTNTTSSAFATLEEKTAFLERHVPFRRTYLQLEYGIFVQPAAGCLARRAAEVDISVMAIVPRDELSVWTRGLRRVESEPPELAGLASTLDLSGVDEWYEGSGEALGLDRARATVVYRQVAR